MIRKVTSAADFIWSDNPLEILGSVTSISFDDEASKPIKDHDLTTEEVNFTLVFTHAFYHLTFSRYDAITVF